MERIPPDASGMEACRGHVLKRKKEKESGRSETVKLMPRFS